MRPGCLDCAYKHIAAAAVADTEVAMGYPRFRIWVIGNLDHAAQEAQQDAQELAWVIREHRIKRMGDPAYRVPYEALAAFIDACQASGQVPKVPPECLDGILVVDGVPVFSMDTRPAG